MVQTFKNQVQFSVDDAKLQVAMKRQIKDAANLESAYTEVGASVGNMSTKAANSLKFLSGIIATTVVVSTAKMVVDFGQSIDVIVNKTKEFGKEYKQTMKEDIIKSSNAFGRSAEAFAASTQIMVKNGFTALDAIRAMNKGIGELSILTGTGSEGMGSAAEAVSGFIATFNLDPIKDVHRVTADLFALVAGDGGFTLDFLASVAGNTGVKAVGANQAYETLTRSLSVLTGEGLSASLAVNGLKELLNTIQRPAADAFDFILRNSDGTIKNIEILARDLADLPHAFGAEGTPEFTKGLLAQESLIKRVFSGPSRDAIKGLIRNVDEFKTTTVGTGAAIADFDKKLNISRDNPIESLAQLTQGFKNIFLKAGDAVVASDKFRESSLDLKEVISDIETNLTSLGEKLVWPATIALKLFDLTLEGGVDTVGFFGDAYRELISPIEAVRDLFREPAIPEGYLESIEQYTAFVIKLEAAQDALLAKGRKKLDDILGFTDQDKDKADQARIENGKKQAASLEAANNKAENERLRIEQAKKKEAQDKKDNDKRIADAKAIEDAKIKARQELTIGITSRAVDTIGDAFANMFKDTDTGFKEMLDGFKNSLLDLVGDLLARKLFEKLLGPLFLTTAKISPTSWIGKLLGLKAPPTVPPVPTPGTKAVEANTASLDDLTETLKNQKCCCSGDGATSSNKSGNVSLNSNQDVTIDTGLGSKGSGVSINPKITFSGGGSGSGFSGFGSGASNAGVIRNLTGSPSGFPGQSTGSTTGGSTVNTDALRSVGLKANTGIDTMKALGLDTTFKRIDTNTQIQILKALESLGSGSGGSFPSVSGLSGIGAAIGGLGKAIGGSLGPVSKLGEAGLPGINDVLYKDIFLDLLPFLMNIFAPGSGTIASAVIPRDSAEGGIFKNETIVRVGEGHGKRKTEMIAPIDDLPGLLNLDQSGKRANPVEMEKLVSALSRRGISIQGGVTLNVKDVSDVSSLQAEIEKVATENFTLN